MTKPSKKSQSLPSFLWDNYRTMSYDVGRKNALLRETGCMNPLHREVYGYLEAFKIFIGKNPSSEKLKRFLSLIDKKLLPMVQKMGQAEWGRDVVTDLGFAKSKFYNPRTGKLDKVLEFVPES